ncbi:MAG: hypothetical protein J7518_08865 [Nocardioidaceae bacterium]|nr:hypothetical protein [Nocardioidaceae bacterium]
MGTKNVMRRRAAALLAALATLVMSSGIALMLTAGSANAAPAPKYFVCKYVGTPGVDERLQTGNNPISVSGNAIGEDPVVIGSFFNDAHGRSYVIAEDTGQPEPSVSECPKPQNPDVTTADVTFTDPTCANENDVDWSGTGDHVSFKVTDGSLEPGKSIEVTATTDEGFVFEGGSTTKVFTHTFDPEVDLEGPPCVIVNPPTRVTPGDVNFIDPTCDTEAAVVLPEAAPVENERAALGKDVDGVHYEITGTVGPGETVQVDATAIAPSELAEGAKTHWEHTFAEVTGCTIVEPPTVVPGSETETPDEVVATPQVVHAGLAEVKPDLRGQQGLALLVGGMILMVVAGGVGFTGRRSES